MQDDKDDYQYNNEEEAEMAQLHSIHLHMNAISDVQRKLREQAAQPSLEECEECGEAIPRERQLAIPGVKYCVFCQEIHERHSRGL